MKIFKSKLKAIISELNMQSSSILLESEKETEQFLNKKLDLLNTVATDFEDLLSKLEEIIELDKDFSEATQSDTQLVYDEFKKFSKVLQILIEDTEKLLR